MSDLYLDLMARALSNDLHPELGHRVLGLVRELLAAQGRPDNTGEVATVMERVFGKGYLAAPADPYARGRWYAQIAADPYTMTQPERIANVREAARRCCGRQIPGALVETGVWRGGLCIMMKAVLAAHGARRKLYVCDSFRGLPEISEGRRRAAEAAREPADRGERRGGARELRPLRAARRGRGPGRGLVRRHDAGLAETVGEIAVLRLDGDYYTSTREVIDPLYDKVAPGGFIIVDDYGCYQQARDAIHDFWNERGPRPPS